MYLFRALYYTKCMPYRHEHAHSIIPTQHNVNDVEPTLEMTDPDSEGALLHLMTDHHDVYETVEPVASDLAEGDSEIKIKILKGIARALVFLEQR